MTDQHRPEDELVDKVLSPQEPLGDKRPEHAHRREVQKPAGRRSGRPHGRPPRQGKSGVRRGLGWAVFLCALTAVGWFGWQWYSARLTGQDDFLLTDPELVPPSAVAGDRAVVLVFPEWDASGYVTEERRIISRNRQDEDLLGIMQGLCAGPAISGAVSPFPRGTLATGAFFNRDDQSVVLDFSEELVTGHPGGSTAEVATLTAILRTLALNYPDTRRCTILVGGAQVETLAGHLTMDRVFDPRRWL